MRPAHVWLLVRHQNTINVITALLMGAVGGWLALNFFEPCAQASLCAGLLPIRRASPFAGMLTQASYAIAHPYRAWLCWWYRRRIQVINDEVNFFHWAESPGSATLVRYIRERDALIAHIERLQAKT